MPVARSAPRLFSFVALVVLVLFGSFLLSSDQPENYKKRTELENRKIVAFSLLKQIEIESEEVDCGGKFVVGGDVGDGGGGLWRKVDGSNVFVYSVHHDRRLYPYGFIRIVAMVRGTWNETFCQIKSSDNHYYITRAKPTKIWSKSWNQNDTHDYHDPYLISCHVPLHKTPIQVSLNTNPCLNEPPNFNIPPEAAPRNTLTSITVCVKPLNFSDDISERLLQWLTITRILGATKIELYHQSIPATTLNMLQRYQKSDNFSLLLHRHHPLETRSKDKATHLWQKRRYEIITYNDCFYRNIATSQLVLPVDVDEIIVPRHAATWAELLLDFLPPGKDKFASYAVRNAYYLRQFNGKRRKNAVFFFEDVVRSDFSGKMESVKSFVSTRNALTLFNHYGLRVLRPGVRRLKLLGTEEVQMNHYKNDCDTGVLPECAKYLSSRVRVEDGVVLKYKRTFEEEYAKVRRLLDVL